MWIFYDETQLAQDYGIAEADVIFYFLFSLVVIPFQIIVDALHYNIAEHYHGLKFFEYLSTGRTRYNARKTIWKLDDDDIDMSFPEKLQRLDQSCFSNQFYFVVTIYVTGMMLLIFGMQTIISAEHNIFADVASYYIVVLFLGICTAIFFLSKFLGKKLRIWNVSVEKSKV